MGYPRDETAYVTQCLASVQTELMCLAQDGSWERYLMVLTWGIGVPSSVREVNGDCVAWKGA